MKIDIDMLRKAVSKKLVSEQIMGFEAPIQIHQGSHTSYDDYEGDYEDDYEHHTKGGDELEMVKQNLFQLSVYAAKLHDMLQEGEDVEEWVQEKIVEATSKIGDVYHYLEYEEYKRSR
jgi:hypothetical protein